MSAKYLYSELTAKIIKLAIKVHKALGPGFVEKIYQRALYLEFKNDNLDFEREKQIYIHYYKANLGYERVDFIIENKVIVELKAVEKINDIHLAQMISYLKASGCQIGLILNFAVKRLEIKRVIV